MHYPPPPLGKPDHVLERGYRRLIAVRRVHSPARVIGGGNREEGRTLVPRASPKRPQHARQVPRQHGVDDCPQREGNNKLQPILPTANCHDRIADSNSIARGRFPYSWCLSRTATRLLPEPDADLSASQSIGCSTVDHSGGCGPKNRVHRARRFVEFDFPLVLDSATVVLSNSQLALVGSTSILVTPG